MNTKQLTYPTIESQKQFWIDKEAQSNNATPETRDALIAALLPFALAFKETTPVGSIPDESIWIWKPSDNRRETHGISRAHLKTAAYLVAQLSTTADPKPEDMDEYDPLLAAYNNGNGDQTDDLSRTEATTDWYDHRDDDYWSLRDEGRNPDGSGESYGERNI